MTGSRIWCSMVCCRMQVSFKELANYESAFSLKMGILSPPILGGNEKRSRSFEVNWIPQVINGIKFVVIRSSIGFRWSFMSRMVLIVAYFVLVAACEASVSFVWCKSGNL